ncbi:TolC family protein [bacterium]|nr:TolC family protein [bacterium]
MDEESKRYYNRAYETPAVNERGYPAFWPHMVILSLIACAAFIAGCASNALLPGNSQEVSPHPETPWSPPRQVIEKQAALRTQIAEKEKNASLIPPEFRDNIKNLGLSDIVDIALLNSKQTRQTWARARAAAAMHGSERSLYLPEIDATASGNKQKNASSGEGSSSSQTTYEANASLSWLLFDFGGRKASVEVTREALYAADWNHNAAIQNVILQVEQSYYEYFAVKALLAAQKAAVDEAQTNLNAAEDRHASGVSTIADVLQARTALSQAVLALESLQGQIMTTRGILATAMGLPANTAFDVELPVGAPPLERTKKSVEEYLETALQERPDLSAARAQALGADAQVRAALARGYPSISANGSIGRLYYDDLSNGKGIYGARIGLSVPLFTGFSHHYDVMAARAQADAAYANAQNVQDIVTLQVWTSYYDLETADQMVRTSDDLLASAEQNHEVAAGRYKAGVGSILDLLTAQVALESARAQQIRSRTNWWSAVTQLAHDTGTLEASPSTGKPDTGTVDRKEKK